MIALTETMARLLQSPHQIVSIGLERLDGNDNVVEDISTDFGKSGSIQHQNYATIHGTCNSIVIGRELNWGVDRIKPYVNISDGRDSARFSLGVYVLTTPSQPVGKSSLEYIVTGYDKSYLLDDNIGESYWIAQGTGYLDAIDQVLADTGLSGITADIDTTSTATLPDDMVWALDADNPVTWLRVINDLLNAIGYQGLWVDLEGVYRSSPYTTVANRSPGWTFDVGDINTNIVFQDRTVDTDAFGIYNWWRFVRKNNPLTPTEGFGMYTVDQSGGGRKYKRVMHLDAADQASLVALGDRQVDSDNIRSRVVKIKTGPLPIMGHFDVFNYNDPEIGQLVAMARSWQIDLASLQSDIELEVIS